MAGRKNQNTKARKPTKQSNATKGKQVNKLILTLFYTAPRGRPKNKKQVVKWKSDFEGLSLQLDDLGFKISEVGNCLFRALADQLEGNEDEHEKYRAMVVSFIEYNRSDFESFLEYDDGPFDDYCQEMGKNRTWAGNMELLAASRITQTNICVHLYNAKPIMIYCDKEDARTLHLAYHDKAHYNSVRLKEDIFVEPVVTFIKDNGEVSTRMDKIIVDRKSEQATTLNGVKAENGHEDAMKTEQTSQCGVYGAAQVGISEQQGSLLDNIVADAEPFDSMKKDANGQEPPQNQEREEFVPPLINVYVRKRKRTQESLFRL